jgi:hypothetical protein
MSETREVLEENDPFAQPREHFDTPPPSGCRNFAMGCGCATAVLMLVIGTIVIWLLTNWKNLAANVAKQAAADAVAKSSLAPADKARVLKRINQLADDFESGKVSVEQIGRVMEQVAQSPLLPLGLVMAADEKYVKPSGLTDDEKQAARRTLQRFARGAFEKTIVERDVEEVMNLVMEPQADGSQQIKERLTDAELKAFLDKARQKADAANVPDEDFHVNIADEIENAIDKALKP